MRSRKIYIILTYSGTVLGKLIKMYTRSDYSHVSLSLDEKLTKMYSFGRLNAYNPFIGGFVHEGVNIGTFKRFKKTKAIIYSLDLTEEQYNKLSSIIKRMEKKKYLYKFNTVGLFAAAFNIKFKKNNCFYCAEFIKYLMEEADVKLSLPEVTKPTDFENINSLELEYNGILKNYLSI